MQIKGGRNKSGRREIEGEKMKKGGKVRKAEERN